jgi:putative FmdB family regulatory protein
LPLYEYRCTQCSHRFDKIQKFNDQPETVCPRCGGALERPLTAPALQFKGAGWYVNDYAAKPAAGGNSDKPAAETASSGETKPAESKSAESKPAESKPAASSSAPAGGSTPSASSTTSKTD